jgi:broad specificity phosphatase PhoE
MKIDFVRHGESENNGKGLITGHLDAPLTTKGEEQAEDTAKKLIHSYSLIYSSDLIRCKQTAEIINRKLNLPIIYDARLRERHFGSLEGKSWMDIHEGEIIKWKDIKEQKYDYRQYGGESVKDVEKRVLSFVNDIMAKKKKIIVVTSAGIIRLLHHLFHGEIQEKIHNASVHEFEFRDQQLTSFRNKIVPASRRTPSH